MGPKEQPTKNMEPEKVKNTENKYNVNQILKNQIYQNDNKD